jgi:Ser/Thr protein kinase RdoA (MazF antagonist)
VFFFCFQHTRAHTRAAEMPGSFARIPSGVLAALTSSWPSIFADGDGDGFAVEVGIQGYSATHLLFRDPAGGRAYFVKLFDATLFEAASELEAGASLAAAAQARAELSSAGFFNTPRPFRTASGSFCAPCALPPLPTAPTTPRPGYVMVFEGVDGAVLHSGPYPAPHSSVSAVGTVLARLNAAAEDWHGPSPARVLEGFDAEAVANPSPSGSGSHPRVCPWDLRHVVAVHGSPASQAEWAPLLTDPSVRALVQRALADAAADIVPLYAASEAAAGAGGPQQHPLRRWWTHGDVNDFNLLVRRREGGEMLLRPEDLSVIDWDDTAYSYLVHDAAIALTYLIMGRGGADADAGADAGADATECGAVFLRSYCATLPLTELEVRTLLPLIRARLATSLIMSAKGAAKEAEALAAAAASTKGDDGCGGAGEGAPAAASLDYLLVHAKPARELLAWSYADGVPARVEALWCAAAKDGAARAPSRRGQSYVAHTLASLSEAQVQTSRGVIAALERLGADGKIGHVVDVPRPAGGVSAASAALSDAASAAAAANASGKAGAIPTARAWGAAGDADDARWPSVPFVYDFSAGSVGLSDVVGTDPVKLAQFTDMMFAPLLAGGSGEEEKGKGALLRIGWGQYFEDRILYQSDHFTGGGGDASSSSSAAARPEARTLHLGVDLEAPPGTPLRAPFPGTVHSWARNTAELDYGPTVILEHVVEVDAVGAGGVEGGDASISPSVGAVTVLDPSSPEASAPVAPGRRRLTFYTLYGHMSLSSVYSNGPGPRPIGDAGASPAAAAAAAATEARASYLPRFSIGQVLRVGDVVGWIGGSDVNGGWPPHVHFQIQTEVGLGGWVGDYPGVCTRSGAEAYALLTPDPNLILRCPWIKPVGAWSPTRA